MADKFNKDNDSLNKENKEMDEFLSEFDKISDDFKKTGKGTDSDQKTNLDQVADSDQAVDLDKTMVIDQQELKPKKSDVLRTKASNAKSFIKNKFFTENPNYRDEGTDDTMAGQTRSKRQKKYRLNKKKFFKFVACLFLAFVLFLGIYTVAIIVTAPEIDPDNIYSYLSEGSVLYDDDGEVIQSIYSGDGNRINIEYDQIPKDMVNAIVAIEDKTFWDHHGFNIVRIFGAIKDSIFSGEGISGTSTITQQLARNVYLSESKQERTLRRKISEAYYTVLLEKNLTKKQILEAYLNTIYLGYNSYGVQAAAQSYFSKDIEDLDLIECASLAAIPKAPGTYSLIETLNSASEAAADADKDDILFANNDLTYIYNGDASKERRNLTIKFMAEQDYISEKQKKKALKEDLSKHVDPEEDILLQGSSYFCDYVVEQVTDDLMEEFNYTYEEAKVKLYTGGLRIKTTMDSDAQVIVEKEYAKSSNFPGVANLNYDSEGNILGKNGDVLLYDYDDYFNSEGEFTLKSDEFIRKNNGNLVIKAGERLNIFSTEVNGATDYSLEFKPLYILEEGRFYSIENGVILIPKKYKKLNSDGDLVISAAFFDDYPEFFTENENSLTIGKGDYSLKQEVVQPQSAMVIYDYHNGEVKAMVGGRETTGKLLYNRAVNPRQPGSAIKPLSVYSSALQNGADAAASGSPQNFVNYDKNQKTKYYGNYWTAASGINDDELVVGGKVWPKNWYDGYKGVKSLRTSVEQSINVNAVRVFQQVGADYAVSQLKKFGVTTVDEDGDVNDLNPAALALGGMTTGISPMEMSAAYGTFPNQGEYTEPILYTKITNKNNETIIEKTPKTQEVIDAGVAYIMSDILRTTVTNGIASGAATWNQVTAGKTGTTTDNYDAWFCGFTPQYSAALWIGNDVNIELSSGSAAAASLWRTIMSQVCEGKSGSFPGNPGNVISYHGEYFVSGTQRGAIFYEEDKKKEEEEKKKKEEEKKKKELEKKRKEAAARKAAEEAARKKAEEERKKKEEEKPDPTPEPEPEPKPDPEPDPEEPII